MKSKGLSTFITLLLLLNMSIFSNYVYATQWDVGEGQTYTSIQSAINNVNTKNNDIIIVHRGIYQEDVFVNKKLRIQANPGDVVYINPTQTGFTVIDNSLGDGSGSIIKGFNIANTPSGTGINISANYCRIEKNIVSGGNVGVLTIGNKTLIQKNVFKNVHNTSVQLGNISIENNAGNINIISNTANECKIAYNKICGGLAGISVLGNKTKINNNIISQTKEQGIALFGTDPIIFKNKIRNMVGKEAKNAITLAAIGNPTSLIINRNEISNIRSTDNDTNGINAFGMSMNSKLEDLYVAGNKFFKIEGFTKSTAISLVGLALGGNLSTFGIFKNKISDVNSKGTNGTSTGISLVALGLDDNKNKTIAAESLKISQNSIYNLNSWGENSTTNGISFVSLAKGNASLSENKIYHLKSDLIGVGITSAGIDFGSNQSHVKINKNGLADIYSKKITSGIESVTFGNLLLIHNSLAKIKSPQTKSITALTFKFASLIGNNIQGLGMGEGIAVKGPNALISYNRIVNFQHYIQNINLKELTEFTKGISISDADLREYLRSQKVPEDQIEPMIKSLNKAVTTLDKIIGNKANAPYNWYGNNNPPKSKFIKNNGTLNYYPWLILNIKANPSTILLGRSSMITANVYQDVAGGNHQQRAPQYFSGPEVTFTTNLGNLGSKSITLNWNKGSATTILKADEGPGIATITASDYQKVQALVTILGGREAPKMNAKLINTSNHITGAPISYMIMAFILLIGGIILPLKK